MGTYRISSLLGPIGGDLGLEWDFDIVDVFTTLGRVPVLGIWAAVHQLPSIQDHSDHPPDLLPGFTQQ